MIWLCSLSFSRPTSSDPAPVSQVSVLCRKHIKTFPLHTPFARGVPSACNALPPGLHRAGSTSPLWSLSNVISSESSLMAPFTITHPTIPDLSTAHHSLLKHHVYLFHGTQPLPKSAGLFISLFIVTLSLLPCTCHEGRSHIYSVLSAALTP